MRDISAKTVTHRTAIAQAILQVAPTTVERIKKQDVPKGDPLPIAKCAAIQAAKNTSQIIPYCHQIALEFVGVEFELSHDMILIETTVKATEKTGVEMEALTAASVAALTIYDMVKMFDEFAEIKSVSLIKKTGGKSDFQPVLTEKVRAAVFVMSDRIAAGKARDESGKHIVDRLKERGVEVVEFEIVPDDEAVIVPAVRRCVDELKLDLIITTGGTGIGPRDRTPEALARLIVKPLPGVCEAIRAFGQAHNPNAMLSRAIAGVRQESVIVSLPGAKDAVKDALDVILPHILHAIPMMEGRGHEHHKHESAKHDSPAAAPSNAVAAPVNAAAVQTQAEFIPKAPPPARVVQTTSSHHDTLVDAPQGTIEPDEFVDPDPAKILDDMELSDDREELDYSDYSYTATGEFNAVQVKGGPKQRKEPDSTDQK